MGKREALARRLGAVGLLGAAGRDVGCAWGLLARSVLLPCPVAVLMETVGWGHGRGEYRHCSVVSPGEVTKTSL